MSIILEKEINNIRKNLMHLSTIVDESVRKSVNAVLEKDEKLAISIIESDNIIDKLEVEIEEECLKVLALHHPVAIDLRYIIACMKINSDLERIGDLTVNIAERAIAIAKHKDEDIPVDFSPIMEKTQQMLSKSINGLIDLNEKNVKDVLIMDNEVDNLNKEIHNKIIKLIKEKPKKTKYFLHILGVSRQLERIADYATNICEDIIYMTEGKIIRHQKQNE